MPLFLAFLYNLDLKVLKQLAKKLLGRQPSPVKSGAQSPEYYDEMYAGSSEYAKPFWQSRYYFLWTVICDRLKQAGNTRVLEIGCGSGQFSELLHQNGWKDYLGLDISSEAIRQAREKDLAPFQFEVADALTTDYFDSYDCDSIVCTEVLEHIEQDRELISRIRPGTRCLCTVPNFPYTSHVRHFESERQVHERYAEYFTQLDVWAIAGSHREGVLYFLADGVRA